MGLLNLENHGLPSVLICLWRALGVTGTSKEIDLQALVAPVTLCDPKKVNATLARWTELGVFIREGDNLRLEPKFKELDINPPDAPIYSEFRNAALDALIAAEGDTAEDFVQSICWFLAQDPFENPVRSQNDAEELSLKQGLTAQLQNTTRWHGLRQWGQFLGLLEDFGQIIPDPSVAISARLGRLFGEKSNLLAGAFLESLAKTLPFLDGGRWRLQEEERWRGRVPLPRPNNLSISLSIALLHLHEEGKIKLERESDALMQNLSGRNGNKVLEFSSVTIGGAS